MNNSIKYYIVKDKTDNSISYFEYDKMNGYDITPKSNVKIKDAVNVNKMIIINPTMINKMVMKKLNKRFENLLRLLSIIFQNDDETGETYREALNEITKLRQEIINKYRKYMETKDEEVFMKKLDILENELKVRIDYVLEKAYEQEYTKEGRSR